MEIWLWVLGIVAAFSLVAVIIDRRRGSSGASRALEERGTAPAKHWLTTAATSWMTELLPTVAACFTAGCARVAGQPLARARATYGYDARVLRRRS